MDNVLAFINRSSANSAYCARVQFEKIESKIHPHHFFLVFLETVFCTTVCLGGAILC